MKEEQQFAVSIADITGGELKIFFVGASDEVEGIKKAIIDHYGGDEHIKTWMNESESQNSDDLISEIANSDVWVAIKQIK